MTWMAVRALFRNKEAARALPTRSAELILRERSRCQFGHRSHPGARPFLAAGNIRRTTCGPGLRRASPFQVTA